MADRLGQQLGHYRLISHLGRGGYADVYLGEHVRLNSYAAVKVLRTHLVDNSIENFRSEARTIAHLLHPNIVRVLDFGVDGNTPFLVMDYVSDGTLRQRHPKGTRLAPSGIVPYVKQIATGLQYAHDQKLIHLDIKPENMLVGRHKEILLSDFGIATIARTSRSETDQNVAATAAYMAPEQIQGHPRYASDQYSLGLVVYEWLIGDHPFHGSFIEMCSQHLYAYPPPLHTKMPEVSLDVEQVVLKALEKDSYQRFPSVQAFAEALEHASKSSLTFATALSPHSVHPPTIQFCPVCGEQGPPHARFCRSCGSPFAASELMPKALPQVPIIKIFYSYAHEDELLRNELEKHLSLLKRQGRIDEWYDRNISAGAEWAQEIDTRLNTASIILLLISPDFMSSEYCYSIEMTRALERHNAREARVIPIILRPVDWQSAPFGKLQALPPEGTPITSWANRDEAFLEVTRGIRQAIQVYLQMALPGLPPPPRPAIVRTSVTPPQTWNIAGSVGPLIMALVTARQWEQAEAEIRAIPDRQSRAKALENFTNALIKEQQWARAEAVARSVENLGQRAGLLRELSRGLGQAQEWGRAEAVVRSIVDDQSRAEALEELGQMLIQAGELGRAREVFRAASEIRVPLVPGSPAVQGVSTIPRAESLAQAGSGFFVQEEPVLPRAGSLPPSPPSPMSSDYQSSRRRTYGILALVALGLLIAIVSLIWSKALTIPSNFVTWTIIVAGITFVIVVGVIVAMRTIRRR